MAKRSQLILTFLFLPAVIFPHNIPEELPVWTHYGRAGTAHLDEWGGLGYYRIKRVRENTFYDLRLLGVFIRRETFATLRYKSSRKFDAFPRLYTFTIVSMRHSSGSKLTIRYHYNQGVGAFLFQVPETHLTTELALSYDMSDYLHDTQKTSYLKGGLFWDVDIKRSSLAVDFEYFYQISDVIPGKDNLTRYELSAELNTDVGNRFLITVGYEDEFYLETDLRNVRAVYLGLGFRKLLPLTF
ncbi:MAG: hypothetical protein V3U24_06315 [Candidatus Neomarinimicrobiota bacterium]